MRMLRVPRFRCDSVEARLRCGVSMLTLAIETSNPSNPGPGAPAVALGRRGEDGTVVLLALERVAASSREHDDLTPAIARVLAAAGVAAPALSRVVVSIGPGGYTSLRMATVTGQMIAEATAAAVVAVPSAMVVAQGAGDGPMAVALAGKKDAAYVTVFERGWAADIATHGPSWGQLMTAADVSALAVERLLADEHVPITILHAARERGMLVDKPTFDAAALLRLGCLLPPIPIERLVPEYGREPEAVTLWRARGTGGAARSS